MSAPHSKDDPAAPRPAERPDTDSPLPAKAAPAEAEIENLRAELTRAAEDAARNHELYLRERAELENFKRRMMREKAEALKFAVEPLVRDLLSVVDNLERAIAHGGADGGADGAALLGGVRLVAKGLLDSLERHGVQKIEAAGRPFDPKLHEALAHVESPEHEPNQVIDQHQCGYRLHERLLRPALVSVCSRKSSAPVASDPDRD